MLCNEQKTSKVTLHQTAYSPTFLLKYTASPVAKTSVHQSGTTEKYWTNFSSVVYIYSHSKYPPVPTSSNRETQRTYMRHHSFLLLRKVEKVEAGCTAGHTIQRVVSSFGAYPLGVLCLTFYLSPSTVNLLPFTFYRRRLLQTAFLR